MQKTENDIKFSVFCVIIKVCPSGEIGIHVCLRSICHLVCRFKSCLGHHLFNMAQKIDLDNTAKKVEGLSSKIDVIMRNRMIIAIFLIVDGITFILNPNGSLPGMAQNIILLMLLAALSVLITALSSKKKDRRTIIISTIILAVGGFFYFYPDLIAAYIQLLLSLFIIYDGLKNIANVLNLDIVSKCTDFVVEKFSRIFNKKAKKDGIKDSGEEQFKEVDDNINEGMEQQKKKLIAPLKGFIDKTNKSSILYIIINIASIVLGIMVLVLPDVSMMIWGIIFLYTGLSNLLMSMRSMRLSKKLKQ